MADTTTQRDVEEWIREKWLRDRFRQKFEKKRVSLTSGGMFEFDGVSEDEKVVANISTSSLKTASGNWGSGKVNKIRSDIYFLVLASGVAKRLMLLTERDMFEACLLEQDHGRVPNCIQFRHVEISGDLDAELEESRRQASDEVWEP